MIDGKFFLEFVIRALATAGIVTLVVWTVARAGPVVGGVVAGLPIVLAPGFWFLIRDQDPAFVAEAATSALFSLSGTQGFLIAYMSVSSFAGPVAALVIAILMWSCVAFAGMLLPDYLALGVFLFAIMTVGGRLVGKRLTMAGARRPERQDWSLVVLRGVAAGFLVGVVTLAAYLLGAAVTGILIAFPIGFCVIAVSLHIDHGGPVVGRTAHAALLGMAGLAAFTFVLALTAEAMPAKSAFLAALLVSLATTTALTLSVVRRRAR